MKSKRIAFMAFLTVLCLALPTFAQQSKVVTKGPIVAKEFKHDTGPVLREIAPLLPEWGTPQEHEIDNRNNPNHPQANKPVEKDPVLQTPENSPTELTPTFNVEFDGIGFGSNFFCNCMPPDNDGAPGTTQYVQYVNTTYQVFDKSGTTLLGPLSGNAFWSGFGGSCQNDNSGDPIIRFDAAAQRWVVSQFAINGSGNDFECVAVSTTSDATGSYNRYAFSFADFPDYPKMGVWPDAYYFTFNNFNLAGSAFVGANACAMDRTKMIAGAAATMVCFQQNSSQFGELPSDLDGATPPAAGTPNFVMELAANGSDNLSMFKFHVDFVTPANSTFTGPTQIPVAAFTTPCPNTRSCVPQPTAGSDGLDGLGDRLMYRLVYRNFNDHTTLLVSHSIVAGSSIGARWYEIHNPETTPTVFQSGTFAPDSKYRWMPSVAMDQAQNIAVGYSRSSATAGDFPSLYYAGRVPGDPAGTLESEVLLKQGAGSQSSGGFDRWGDYTSMTVDPTDDCTFWFSEEYLKTTGANSGFNWSTAIGSFKFAGCGGVTPDFSLTASPNSVTVAQGSSGTSTITVVPVNGFTGSVTLSASGLPSGVTAAFVPNPTTSTSTLTLTASGTAATGTVTVTITGVSGSLTHTTTLSLTVNAPPNFTLSASPTSVTITQGNSGTSTITVNPTGGFSGSVTLSASGLPSGVTAGFAPNPTTSTSTLTLTASGTAATGTVTVTITGVSGSLTHTTTVSLTVNPAGAPDYSLTASPNSVTITQGNSGTSTITVVPVNGFSGSVTLSASGLPSGVTAGFAPNPTTSTSTLTLTASGTATTGTVTVTITGVSGSLTHTTTLSLTVNPSGGAGLSVSPTSLTFAKSPVGKKTAAKIVTVTNNETVTVLFSSITVTGDFQITTGPQSCTSAITAGKTCQVKVLFDPTATGVRTGILTLTDSATNSPQTVSLSGTGK